MAINSANALIFSTTVDSPITQFAYDATDRLILSQRGAEPNTARYYRNKNLYGLKHADETMTQLYGEQMPLAVFNRSTGTTLLGVSSERTPVCTQSLNMQPASVYSPFGQRDNAARQLVGFKGQMSEAQSNWQFLGAGHRVYNPTSMRFHSPDRLSPFASGGLNPYAYCTGDPINFVDPTGRTPWWAWALNGVGIAMGVLATIASAGAALPLLAGAVSASAIFAASATLAGVASLATGIASITLSEVMPNSAAGEILGWVSLGLGVLAGGLSWQAGRSIAGATRRLNANPFEPMDRVNHNLVGRIGPLKVYKESSIYVVKTHGAAFISEADSLVSGGTLGRQLKSVAALSLDPESAIRLTSCHSGVGGVMSSQAQRVADTLNRTVIGYSGPVTSVQNTGQHASQFFFPQQGMAKIRTQMLNDFLHKGAWLKYRFF